MNDTKSRLCVTRFVAAIILVAAQTTLLQQANADARVSRLNAEIAKAGGGWSARDNWVTHLSKAELNHIMGLSEPPSVDTQFAVATASARSRLNELPAVLDWRNKDGKNWVSPILNQANCGSCVAFASIGALETQYRISSGFSAYSLRLSPQDLFSCGGGSCDWGWMPQMAAQFLQQTGVVDEACHPYLSGATGEDVACNAVCADADRRRYRVSNFTTPTSSSRDVAAVKAALQHGPLVTTLTVHADFLAYASGVYKHVYGDPLGGHAVSIVGYDDNKQAYIIRNSWGEDWGDHGFAYVSYDDVSGIGVSTWSFEVPSASGAVSVLGPRDAAIVSQVLSLDAVSSFAGTQSQTITLFDAQSKPVYSSQCAAVCKTDLDVRGLSDGRYELQLTSQNSLGVTLGQSSRQSVYIANQKPKLAILFQGKPGIDLSKPLSGRPEFVINATSSWASKLSSDASAIQMSALEFHYRDSAGIETVRHSDVVVNPMTLGWRTTVLKNGRYEIWMVARFETNQFAVATESKHEFVTIQN